MEEAARCSRARITDYGIPTLNQLAQSRRQSLSIAGCCGIAGIRMDPLAILGRGAMGNYSCDRICTALSAPCEINAAEAHAGCAHYIGDHRYHRYSAGNADQRLIAAGSVFDL